MDSIVRELVVEDPDLSLARWLSDAGVAVHRVGGTPDAAALINVIESPPGLLGVQLCCIGDDSVDKQACGDDGVLVFNEPAPASALWRWNL